MPKQRLRLKASNFSFSRTWEGAILFGEPKPTAAGYLVTFPHPVGTLAETSTTWFYSHDQVQTLPPLTRDQKPRYTIVNGVIALVIAVATVKGEASATCEGCAYQFKNAKCQTAPPCNAGARFDNKSVIFITDIAKQLTVLSGGLS